MVKLLPQKVTTGDMYTVDQGEIYISKIDDLYMKLGKDTWSDMDGKDVWTLIIVMAVK